MASTISECFPTSVQCESESVQNCCRVSVQPWRPCLRGVASPAGATFPSLPGVIDVVLPASARPDDWRVCHMRSCMTCIGKEVSKKGACPEQHEVASALCEGWRVWLSASKAPCVRWNPCFTELHRPPITSIAIEHAEQYFGPGTADALEFVISQNLRVSLGRNSIYVYIAHCATRLVRKQLNTTTAR